MCQRTLIVKGSIIAQLVSNKTVVDKVALSHENCQHMGGSPGLEVMRRDSRSEGRGFKPCHHLLDGHFSHIFVVKIVVVFV